MVVHTAPNSLNTDVLIIGAGPAGLMAALTLSHLGVGVRVLDRRYVFTCAASAFERVQRDERWHAVSQVKLQVRETAFNRG